MKKLIITLDIAILGISAMAQEKKVAVFEPTGSIDANLKAAVRDEISSIVVKTDGYSVILRQQIYRVLEENNVEPNSLVDDLRVSEVGKRMGANLAFMSHITQMGNNYYVSCKLIDVMTAQIVKQETMQTLYGLDDLMDVVNKLANDMLDVVEIKSEMPKVEIMPELPKVETTTKFEGMLLSKGTKVYLNNENEANKIINARGKVIDLYKPDKLSKNEVRELMANNTNALWLYNNGVKRNRNGNIFMIYGTSLAAIGGGLMLWSSILMESNNGNVTRRSSKLEDAGFNILVFASIPVFITGVTLKSVSIKPIRQSVDMYNSGLRQNTSKELKFGITGNGVGLALSF